MAMQGINLVNNEFPSPKLMTRIHTAKQQVPHAKIGHERRREMQRKCRANNFVAEEHLLENRCSRCEGALPGGLGLGEICGRFVANIQDETLPQTQ